MRNASLALLAALLLSACTGSGTLDVTVDDDDDLANDDDAADDDDATSDDDDSTPPPCEDDEFFARPNGTESFDLWRYDDAAASFARSESSLAGSGRVYATIVGDFNGDGGLDIVVEQAPNWPSEINVLLLASDCAGGFTESPIDVQIEDSFADLFTAADVDNDGDLDLVGWTWDDGEGLLWLNQDGRGTEWRPVGLDGDAPFALELWDTDDHGEVEAVALPLRDFDGDGSIDLLECANARSTPSTCVVHLGEGGGAMVVVDEFTVERQVNGVAVGDFTGDGALDFVGGLDDDGDAGQAWIWGSSNGAPVTPAGAGQDAFDVEAGGDEQQDAPGYGWMATRDWDRDGVDDLIISVLDPFGGAATALYVAWGNGDGGFEVESVGEGTHNYGGDDFWVQDFLGLPVR